MIFCNKHFGLVTKTIKILPESIKRVLIKSPSLLDINNLVRISQKIAVTRLTQIINKQKIRYQILPNSIQTTALDCIAEIFQRDDENRFIELENYFSENNSLDELTDEVIVMQFRRLVFSKLNDGIFRLYREYDPILSRIIRNIKLAVNSIPELKQFTLFGQTNLSLVNYEECEIHLPPVSSEELLGKLIEVTKAKTNIKTQLESALILINGQTECRKYIALIDLATLLKELNLKLAREESGQSDSTDNTFQKDLTNIFNKTVAEFESIIKLKYVNNNKLTPELSEKYINSIKDIIYNTYIMNNGMEQSYYDYLASHASDINYEEYRSKHRSIFEYIVKLSKKMFVDKCRDELY